MGRTGGGGCRASPCSSALRRHTSRARRVSHPSREGLPSPPPPPQRHAGSCKIKTTPRHSLGRPKMRPSWAARGGDGGEGRYMRAAAAVRAPAQPAPPSAARPPLLLAAPRPPQESAAMRRAAVEPLRLLALLLLVRVGCGRHSHRGHATGAPASGNRTIYMVVGVEGSGHHSTCEAFGQKGMQVRQLYSHPTAAASVGAAHAHAAGLDVGAGAAGDPLHRVALAGHAPGAAGAVVRPSRAR
eukprot:scaffold5027_cov255-Prasinococcus_capsulatus_cf.AAC.7